VTKEWLEKYQRLAQQLEQVSAIRSSAAAADGEGPEWTLAHALADIDEAATEYQPALERLVAASTPDEIADALQDALEALRHIAYHLADPPYLREMLEAQLASVRDAEAL
jgi:alkanesulfonate monooxygenase SsuD/methylene tetrahydromethanopterin reductase-like flavin-dependent oxidoreductase (luciferase family)